MCFLLQIMPFLPQKQRKTRRKPTGFALKNLKKKINQAINDACDYAVDDDRTGDDEHLGRHTKNQPFCLWSSRTH